jgi:hypothetical protein
MIATHRTNVRHARSLAIAMDVMRPSAILGPPAPGTDDPRRWLRMVWHALGALACAATAVILIGARR